MRRKSKNFLLATLTAVFLFFGGLFVASLPSKQTASAETSSVGYFEMAYGGEVGLSKSYSGIRFRAYLSEEWYKDKTKNGEEIRLGMLIAPYKAVGEDITKLTLETADDYQAYNIVNHIPVEFVNGEYSYTGAIYYDDIVEDYKEASKKDPIHYPPREDDQLLKAAYKKELCARGYASIRTSTGWQLIGYTDWNYNSRSPRQVANAALAHGDIDNLPNATYDSDYKAMLKDRLDGYIYGTHEEIQATEVDEREVYGKSTLEFSFENLPECEGGVAEILIGGHRMNKQCTDKQCIAERGGVPCTNGQHLGATVDRTGATPKVVLNSLEGLPVGEEFLSIIDKSGNIYRKKVLCITKYITTAEDLAKLHIFTTLKQGENAYGNTFYNYGGYFVLANDLDASKEAEARTFAGKTVGSIGTGLQMLKRYGFHGTFDGRGHTIKGYTFGVGGVFGDIGESAVIKNVAFTDCTVQGNGTRTNAVGVLASNARGSFTISNVYVQGTIWGANSGILLGRSLNGGRFENIVVDMKVLDGDPSKTNDDCYNIGALAGWDSGGGEAYVNVKIIYDHSASTVQHSKTIGNDYTNTTNGIKEYQRQADGTLREIISKTNGDSLGFTKETVGRVYLASSPATAGNFSSFTSSVWTVVGGVGPVFKTTEEDTEILDLTKNFTLDLEAENPETVGNQILAGVKGFFGNNTTVTAVYEQDDLTSNITDDASYITTIDTDNPSNEEGRRKTLLVHATVNGKAVVCKLNVLVVTKIIKTAKELAKMQSFTNVQQSTYDTAKSGELTSYSYGGYFILGNSLHVSQGAQTFAAPSIGVISSIADVKDGNGFSGTFDGRGYIVDGFTYGIGGVFGDITNNAVIKNVGFVNCTVGHGNALNHGVGVLSANAKGNYSISNVHVQGTIWSANSGMLFGRSMSGGTLKDVVVDMSVKYGTYTAGAFAGMYNHGATYSFNNIIIVYGNTDYDIRESKLIGADHSAIAATLANGIREYQKQEDGKIKRIDTKVLGANKNVITSVGTYQTVAAVSEFVNFDKTYWSIAGGYAPKFQGAYAQDGTALVDLTADRTVYVEAKAEGTLGERVLAEIGDLIPNMTEINKICEEDALTEDLKDSEDYLDTIDSQTPQEEARTKNILIYGADSKVYKVKILVATKIIRTANELANLIDYANQKTTVTGSKEAENKNDYTGYETWSYNGYFVLGNDLTQDSENPITFTGPSLGSANNKKIPNISTGFMLTKDGTPGFHGTFDGLGHKVDGFNYGVGGVFGFIGAGAVIKNVAFTNCVVGDKEFDVTRNESVLAQGAYGASGNTWTLDNVYVQGTMNGANSGMLFGYWAYYGTISNTLTQTQSNYISDALGAVSRDTNNLDMNNFVAVYVKGEENRNCKEYKPFGSAWDAVPERGTGSVAEYELQDDGTIKKITAKDGSNRDVTDITLSATVAAAADFANFDTDYWTVTAGYAPIFKTKV